VYYINYHTFTTGSAILLMFTCIKDRDVGDTIYDIAMKGC